MEFNAFLTRLQEVKNISLIENGYSHIIYELISYKILDNQKYMLIDTSSYQKRESNRPLIGENLGAIPDFVITNRTQNREEIKRLGCIEVKFKDADVDEHLKTGKNNRLVNYYTRKGYLETYNYHVLYTNGWKWNYYNDKKLQKPTWSFDFLKEKCNSDTYYDLLKNLARIDWECNDSK